MMDYQHDKAISKTHLHDPSRLQQYYDILGNVYKSHSSEVMGDRLITDKSLINFQLAAGRYYKETRASMDLVMLRYNLTAVDALWVGTFITLFVWEAFMAVDDSKEGDAQIKNDIKRYSSYNCWVSSGNHIGCSIRASEAITKILSELLDHEDSKDQDITARIWSLYLDSDFFDSQIAVAKDRFNLTDLWQKTYDSFAKKGVHSEFKYNIIAADHHVLVPVEEHVESKLKMPKIRTRDVPRSHYGIPNDMKQLERRYMDNRYREKDIHGDDHAVSRTKQWILDQAVEIEAAMANIRKDGNTEEEKQRYIKQPKVKEVKKTTATILREEAILKKIAADEKKRLSEEAIYGRNARESIEQLVDNRLQEDEDLNMAKQAKRRIQVQLSHEEAILAKRLEAQKKQEIASRMKQESKLISKMIEDRESHADIEKVRQIGEIKASRASSSLIKEKIIEERRQVAENLSNYLRNERERALADEQHEREVLLEKIRVMKEKSALDKQKKSENPGQQVQSTKVSSEWLSSLSTEELKTELESMRKKREEEVAARSQRIGQQRRQMAKTLEHKTQFIEALKSETRLYSSSSQRTDIMSNQSTRTALASREFDEVEKLRLKLEKMRRKTRSSIVSSKQ
eukprot:Partr_v1_DN29001_c0_g1_i2_m58826